MNELVIYTDSSCDLDKEFLENLGVKLIPLVTTIDGADYKDRVEITPLEFYEKLREDKNLLPKTSLVTPNRFEQILKKDTEEGKKILVFTISSKLSGTYNSLLMAKEELGYEDIYAVDSKGASIGVGLLVIKAVEMAKEGRTVEDIVQEVTYMRDNMEYVFAPGSLEMLRRGGRISSTKAAIGNILSIKPICHIKDGAISMFSKIRGEKALVRFYMKELKDRQVDSNYTIGIAHANNPKLVEIIKVKLKEEFNIDNLVVTEIGAVIGTHIGEGTTTICFVRK